MTRLSETLCRLALTLVLITSLGAGAPAESDVLDRAARSAEAFMQQFRTVTCIESVLQTKTDEKGALLQKQESSFDYLILLDMTGGEPSIEESRLLQKTPGKSRKRKAPLLVTSGFPTLLLIFHPHYQDCYEFRVLGDDTLDGRSAVKVEFRHIHGLPSTTVLRVKDREYPLDVAGTAWIEPESGAVMRISAGIESPIEALGLKGIKTEVTYSPVSLAAGPATYWLPATASIELATARQHWRNIHRFINYKQFSVKSESEVKK